MRGGRVRSFAEGERLVVVVSWMCRWPGCAQEMVLWVGLLRTHQLRVKQVLIPVCKPLLCSWSSSTEEIVHLVLILD